MSRTDIHRPSAIVPAHYRFVVSYALPSVQNGWPVPALNVDRVLELRRTEKFAATGGLGSCSICGAHYNYGDVWQHEPTGEHIHVGHDCAQKYTLLADRSEFELELGDLRAASARECLRAQKAERKAAFLSRFDGLAEDLAVDHPTVRDIAARFEQFNLSDKQVALVQKLAHEVRNPRPAEQHVPAPTGKVTFKGLVVSTKAYDGDWGTSIKITVKVQTPAGSWLAWGTAPAQCLDEAANEGGLKGCELELTATLKPGRDAHFAIMSRPRGRVLNFRPGRENSLCEAEVSS